ncbi:MAG: P-II family nitrogen regulator [Thermoproteota archaeon]|jgi:Amt family ammonium transporter|nr:P-II family nitrogen regulator [Thermoproteota archaeon]
MKKLEIIFSHERLTEVNDLLHKHGVGGMNFYNVRGRGSSKSEAVSPGRGIERYVPEFAIKTKTEVVTSDETANQIIKDVLDVMSSGSNRSGKIFVYDVAEAYDFKSKKSGVSAL